MNERGPREDAPELPGHCAGIANDSEYFAGAGVGVGDR